MAQGDVKSIAKILSELTPPMTIEAFQQYLMEEASKKETVK